MKTIEGLWDVTLIDLVSIADGSLFNTQIQAVKMVLVMSETFCEINLE